MIPKQLQNSKFRFVLLGKWDVWRNEAGTRIQVDLETYEETKKKKWVPLGKAPFEKEWQKNGYTFDSEKLLKHISEKNNFGIIGGHGNLRILDIDDENLAETLTKQLDTFTIKTGGGGRHFYFLSSYDANHVLVNELGELRANNYQVVCSPCRHPSGNYYKIINDVEIRTIGEERIKAILKPYLRQTTINAEESKQKPKNTSGSGLEYRKVLALLREKKTKEEIFEEMLKYAKWAMHGQKYPQYRESTYNKAKQFVESENKIKKNVQLDKFITKFTDKHDLVSQFYDIQPIYFDSHKLYWLWNFNKYKWEKVDETDLMIAISSNSYANTIKSQEKHEILEAIRQSGRINKPLDPPKTWIQFKDKIVDIKTNEIFKASPKYFITNPIPWELGDSEETPTIDKIFEEWVVKSGIQDESYINTLYEIIAYSMLSCMPIHRIFCLIGEGLNGKGSFLRLIEKLLGKDNITSTNMDILTRSNFEAAKLYKKLVVAISEVDKDVFTKTALIKGISGDDLMRIEHKGKDGFDEHLYATPICACNILPETSDKTKGFFRRWTIIDFPNRFDEKKDILSDIPEEEFHNLCRKSIRILQEVLKKGEFTNDGSIENREQRYEAHSNPIDKFINEFCEKDSNEKIVLSEFYEKFKEFQKSLNYRVHSKIETARSLTRRKYEKKIIHFEYSGGYTTKMCILGLKWKY